MSLFDLTWIDILIVVVFLLSTGIALMRGFVREAISLVSWAIAIFLSIRYAEPIADLLPATIASIDISAGTELGDGLRLALAFILILVVSLLLSFSLNRVLAHVTKMPLLRGLDSTLGMLFGVTRAAAIVVLLILASAAFTPLPNADAWRQAQLIGPFNQSALWLIKQMPGHYSERFYLYKQILLNS
jgi:membrane protein required for colicin V production